MLKNTNSIHRFFLLLIVCFANFYANSGYGLVWNTPPEVFVTDNLIITSDLAVDPAGNSLTIFVRGDEVAASYFNAVTESYEPIQVLDSGVDCNHVSVAMDATGNGIAVWIDYNTLEVRASLFTAGVWGPIEIIETNIAYGFSFPDVAMDGSGNGIVMLGVNSSNDLYSRTVSSSGVWGVPVLTGLNSNVEVAYAPTGEAIASGAGIAISYDGTSWGAPISTGFYTASSPGMDAAGNGLVVFTDYVGEFYYTFYDGTTFSPVSLIPIGPATSSVPGGFAMSANGTAILGYNNGVSNFYTVFDGSSWSAPIPSNGGKIAIDSNGNAVFVWADAGNIFSNSLPAGGVLGPTNLVGAGPNSYNDIIWVGLSDNGRAFSNWGVPSGDNFNFLGTYSLFGEPTSPPGSIDGFSCSNKFAFQTDYIHIITWTASPDPTVTSYYVRRNGALVAVVPTGCSYIYEDHNQSRHATVTYSVTAVGELGESEPLSIQLR